MNAALLDAVQWPAMAVTLIASQSGKKARAGQLAHFAAGDEGRSAAR
jgi:hypothetical protein